MPLQEKENKKSFRGWKKYAAILMLTLFLFVGAIRPVYAFDPFTPIIAMWDGLKYIGDKVYNIGKDLFSQEGSYALQVAISRGLNTIAYDTATWIASGKEGQKPQYFKGSFGDAVLQSADIVAGNFIDTFFSKGEGVDFCSPSLNAKLQIGLGLESVNRPPLPNCTASIMIKNWGEALKGKDFLKNFSGYFDIHQNDLGLALTAQTGLLDATEQAKLDKALEISKNGRWQENINIAGDILGLPNEAETEQMFANNMYYANFGQFTGNALGDAANTFLNQLAITAFQRAMRNITASLNKGSSGSTVALGNSQAGPVNGGAAAAQGVLRKIIQPKFNSNADYDILSKLAVCSQSIYGGVGPTDCVIDERFRQAIADQKTVREALADGSLKGDAPFGYLMGGDYKPLEPSYNQGYPYRSLIILRKYRIIPVGWELAAEFIRTHIGEADVAGANTLANLVACFDQSDRWCAGLVDPDWVLKAPQNYCAKQGYGPQILNSQVNDQGVDAKGNKLPPKLTVTRTDTYCADEQSCIKENSDGSCKYFGYCSEDKRIWKFGSDSCAPQYNTCQTFRTESGDSVSYLKNSLQYCDASQAGCEKYAVATADTYNPLSGTLDWTKNGGDIFLNKNAQGCDQNNEGCHEFLRLSSGLGTNLLLNSDFESDAPGAAPTRWGIINSALITDTAPDHGGLAVQVNANSSPAGIYSLDHSAAGNVSVMPEGVVLEPEVSYTLSADVYLVSGQSVTLALGREGNFFQQAQTTTAGSWQRLTVTILNNAQILANELKIFGTGANNGAVQFYVDNVKFEIGGKATAYSGYRDNNLIYEKFLPEYLRDACYNNPDKEDFTLKDNAPAVCGQFARQCNREEANCELYTNIANGGTIPAAVTDGDLCAKECVGYNTFVQAEDNFSSNHARYFIPATAKTCSAEAVGCEEFTNLASSTAGGEQKQYYSYLRQCVKPTDAGVACGGYYSYESSASAGQELVRYTLESQSDGQPAANDNSALCSADIYNKPPTDPNYNSDCRQFYDNKGNISYHLYSRTISCSDSCQSYRLSRKNILDSVNSAGACGPAAVGAAASEAGSFHWDDSASQCVYCKNGGVWDDAQQNCVYKALASESGICDAAASGCAQYNGDVSANSRLVLDSEFESGADAWTGGSVSTASYVAGKHSYQFSGATITDNVGADVNQGAAYVLQFLARAENGNAVLSAELDNGTDAAAFNLPVTVKGGQWGLYNLNLPALNQTVSGNETLVIKIVSGSNTVYLDSIKLTETTDRYYLIEDSWNTPAVCDQDLNGNPYPLFMLGCSQYKDRASNIFYLHSFNRVCQESAVGCQAMIDTANSTSPDKNDSYGATSTIAADRLTYAVYDPTKFCGAADKGCQRLGLTTSYEGQISYQDSFLRNNPDSYSSILCGASGVGCDLFTTTAGSSYFKNPHDMVCEYRQGQGAYTASNGWGWYKKKVTRCGGTGSLCAKDDDCFGASCQAETVDYPCPTEKLKTLGQGGVGNEVLQPGSDGVYHWAGLCPDDQSSCSEYVDPVSDFATNLISNSDFKQNVTCRPGQPDCWGPSLTQDLDLPGNHLYILAVDGTNNNAATLNNIFGAQPSFRILNADNTFGAPLDTISVSSGQSVTFYLDRTVHYEIQVKNINPENGNKIILRQAVVDYQLADGVDRATCNGAAKPTDGCVQFNERSVDSSGVLTPLGSDNPWAAYGSSIIAPNMVNALLKVRPDRVCDQWLSCKSYVKDENNKNVCLDIANCDRLDDAGNCANFTVLTDAQKQNRVFDPRELSVENKESIKNLTGYVKVGTPPQVVPPADSKLIPTALANFGTMTQDGKNVTVPNGDFEFFVATSTDGGGSWVGRPANWSAVDGTPWKAAGADGMFSVVSDPKTAQNLGVKYPMIGQAFLKYNAGNSA
ncbi:MAG TPA: hypothetical protein VMD74_03065, partial [Candidatus Methylomirabilis sp.]|nr:hypothetical protein [Candidatus Methylomirabilis sp.]